MKNENNFLHVRNILYGGIKIIARFLMDPISTSWLQQQQQKQQQQQENKWPDNLTFNLLFLTALVCRREDQPDIDLKPDSQHR